MKEKREEKKQNYKDNKEKHKHCMAVYFRNETMKIL